MRIKKITAELSAKVPMQDFGALDLKVELVAEIAEDEDAGEAMQELTDNLYGYLEQMLAPAIVNKLEYAARLIQNWPDQEQQAYWKDFLEAENVQTIRRSGVVKPDTFFEFIDDCKETALSALQKQP